VQDADLASAAEELYALSPGDFTAARDERAAQARAAGDRDLARAVGALRRPTVSAWLVNQLARQASGQVAELLELGESLRRAHQDLAGEQVRELSLQRRQLVAALTAEAKRLAERDGRAAGLQVEREVEATLQAALADADAAAAVRAGCLASPLSYAGLGAGDQAGAVAVVRRATAPRKAARQEKAPAMERTPAKEPAKERAPAKEPAKERAPARERAGGRRGRETPAEREARQAAEAAERQARLAAAEAERRAARIAEAEQAVRQAADAAAAATAELDQAERQAATARAAQEAARKQVERLDKELSQAIAAESQANRAVRDAQRAKETAARAADAATRRLARAETAARRLD
jgi:DNA polymerase III gamma/tau subunit